MTSPHRLPGRSATGQVVVGIDVGTTAVKAVAFTPGSPGRTTAVREYPLLEPSPGHQVQDPATVVEAVLDALAECVAATAPAEVLAISVSAAMHGLLALDAERRPLTPLVTWADARAVEQSRALHADGRAAALHQASGTPVHPMSPLVKLRWFARHEPALAASARWWVGLKDLVLLHLTGELVTELSSASATGLLDVRALTWHPGALEVAQVSERQLPPVLSPTASLGLCAATAARVGLPAGTPVVVGAADGPLGNLGTGAVTPGVAGLSLGTSGAVRMVVPAVPAMLEPSLFCYALTEDAWVVGSAVSNGGIVVRWAGDALAPVLPTAADGRSRDAELLALAATAPPGSDGLLMLPHLLPERGPLWDPDVPGAYLGLRRRHTRAHLVRAAVEGVCLQLSSLVEALDRVVPVTSVRATGGTLRAPLWRQVLAASLGRPLVVTGNADGSALGAAALALLSLGVVDDLASAVALLSPETGVDCVEPPDPAAVAVYAQLRAAAPALVAALVPAAEALAGTGTAGSAR